MRLVWVAVLMVCARFGALEAQTVRGQLVDSVSRAPLSGAFVALLDERGAERARVVTDGAGRFVLTAPEPGSYRIRVKRIGFRPSNSPLFALRSHEATTYNAAIDPIPVALQEVVVAGERDCDVQSDDGSSVAALWDEVRTALAAVAWTSREPGYWYELLHFQRELNAGGRRRGADSTWSEIGYQQVPFRSAPATQLEEQGYVIVGEDGWTYYAPDADVLLSDPFVRTHCFETKAASGLVGLAFTPERDRTLSDIKGALWVDRDNAELQYLEFWYTRLPEGVVEPRAGGRVEFLRVPTGAWIVRDWVIRMPLTRIVRTPTGEAGFPQVVGFREAGGNAVEIKTSSGVVVYSGRAPNAVAAAPPPAPAPLPPIPAYTAQPLENPAPSASKPQSKDREQLRRAEFEGSTAADAYGLVEQLRPAWLHYRGPLSLRDTRAGDLKVYVDGLFLGDESSLHHIPVIDVERLRHLSGPDATMRYGEGHGGGVIEVWTRRS